MRAKSNKNEGDFTSKEKIRILAEEGGVAVIERTIQLNKKAKAKKGGKSNFVVKLKNGQILILPKSKYLDTKEASYLSGLEARVINQLCRDKKLKAQKYNNRWFIYRTNFDLFFK